MTTRAVIRADAGPSIGLGHVARCLTLADALAGRGVDCTLAIDPAGAPSVPTAWLGPVRVTSPEDQYRDADLLIVDHYALSETFETPARSWARTVVVLDDLADRRHDCDLLVDPSIGRTPDDYAPLTSGNCKLLLGPAHALLRPTYADARARCMPRRHGAARRILVSLGGTDPRNFTSTVLQGLQQAKVELQVDVVLPQTAPWFSEVAGLAARMGASLHPRVDDLSALMISADLSIGAGGTSSWERVCVGLPTLIVKSAANQDDNIQRLVEAGAAVEIDPVTADAVADGVDSLASDPARLAAMSEAAAALCDGRGTERVVDAIIRLVAVRGQAGCAA